MSSRQFLPLGAVLFAFVAVMLIAGVAYLDVMFDRQVSAASVIEAANYASQTVTTVGYGNWVPSNWDLASADLAARVLRMKEASVVFVLIGGALFAILTGLVANLISRL